MLYSMVDHLVTVADEVVLTGPLKDAVTAGDELRRATLTFLDVDGEERRAHTLTLDHLRVPIRRDAVGQARVGGGEE